MAFADVVIADVRAGSVLAMSDKVLHCSGPNASSATRRAWMPQFSDGAVARRDPRDDERAAPVALAVPIDALEVGRDTRRRESHCGDASRAIISRAYTT